MPRTDENDPRYWRGKLMTASRMGRDDDARAAVRQLELLRATRHAESALDVALRVPGEETVVALLRQTLVELEVSRATR